jgi:hypothetical protein
MSKQKKITNIILFYGALFLYFICGNMPTTHAGSASTQVVFRVPNLPTEFVTIRRAAETQSIRMTLNMPRITQLGLPILADIQLINGRNEKIKCDHDQDSRDFFLTVYDVEGKRVNLTDYGQAHQGSPYTYTYNPGLSLKPGESILRQYDLTKYFELSTGQYRLNILKTVASTPSFEAPDTELNVEIDSVYFDITKRS